MTTQNQLTTTQSQLTTIQNQLMTAQDNLESVSEQLVNIQRLYPLKDFPSRSALQNWVYDNLQPFAYTDDAEFRAACKMVELGMEEGYWIGIDLEYDESLGEYFVWCCAFANDQLYIFFPDYEVEIIAMGFYR